MKKKLLMLTFALLVGSTAMAQNTVTLKGVLHDNRYKDDARNGCQNVFQEFFHN
jgi:hypothetical protein